LSLFTAISDLRNHWRPILAVHLFFTVLGITALTPLLGASVRGVVALSGSAALADQDIALLLLSPAGILAAVLLASLLLAITGLEVAALQAIAKASADNRRISGVQATMWALRQASSLLRLTLQLTLRVLAYLLPYLVTVAAIAWTLLGNYDINYYLSERPASFIAALALAGLATVLLLWFLGRRLVAWCLSLPLLLFGGSRPAATFGDSERLTTHIRSHCLRTLAGWLILVLAASIVPPLFLTLSTAGIVSAGVASLQLLVVLLCLAGIASAFLGFLVNACSLGLFAIVIQQLYNLADAPGHNTVLELDSSRSGPEPRPLVLGGAAIVLAVVSLGSAVSLLGSINVADRAVVVAHRGAAGSAPENTLAAVRQAVDDGADWVEIDVQESRDGHVVVVHDSDFMKLAANPLKVWDGDLADIQKIDVGSWFDPRFTNEHVPTLQQVLEVVRGKSGLVIELKYYGHDQQLERRVVDIVEEMQMADQVVVMSLKLPGIERLQALRPEWTTGLLAATAVGDLTRLEVDFLAVSQNIATPALIKRAQDSGKQVYVWTVNDALSLSRWMSMGVDGVITDEPALAKDILLQRAQLSPAERLLLGMSTFFGTPEIVRQYRDNSP
jgi:glycerophosphoryl diester phosphodiesterase